MLSKTVLVLATFTTPEQVGTTPLAMLLLLPLLAAVSVAYKATKVKRLTAAAFLSESALLFAEILVFMALTALVLCVIAWLVTG